MKLRRFGLELKFVSLIVALLSIIFAAIAFVMLSTNIDQLRSDLFERSKAFTALATKPIGTTYLIYKDSGTSLIAQQIDNFTVLDKSVTNVSVVDLNGGILFSQKPSAVGVSKEQAQSFEPVYIYNERGTISRVIYPFKEDSGRRSYSVIYDISSDNVDRAVANLTQSIILYSALGLVISAALTYFFINRMFIRPIQKVRDSALLISSGQYAEQARITRHDEIGDLAKSVNQMADSLKADIQKLIEVDKIKSEFMMIASHNLRTPISIINGYLDLVRTQDLSDVARKIINSISANSQRLSVFAEDILITAGIESGQDMFECTPTSVDGLFDNTIREFTVLTDDKKITFSHSITPTSASINASPVHLRSAVWNLLENALKFTPEQGTIILSVVRHDDKIEIAITDDGIGITADEQAKLFTKFHRGTSTMKYDYEGTGIGLYITKLIVTAHKGSIQVDSTPGKGTTFTISLPIIA